MAAVEERTSVRAEARYVRTAPPGPHFKLPLGIEQVTKVRRKPAFLATLGGD